jgi:hypothetical protein
MLPLYSLRLVTVSPRSSSLNGRVFVYRRILYPLVARENSRETLREVVSLAVDSESLISLPLLSFLPSPCLDLLTLNRATMPSASRSRVLGLFLSLLHYCTPFLFLFDVASIPRPHSHPYVSPLSLFLSPFLSRSLAWLAHATRRLVLSSCPSRWLVNRPSRIKARREMTRKRRSLCGACLCAYRSLS